MKLITLINEYLDYRRALGSKMLMSEVYLKSFARMVGKKTGISAISKSDVNEFLYKTKKITSTWFRKYEALNGLYCYAVSRDHVGFSPMPTNLPKHIATFTPYIYTHQELKKIFDSALIYKYRKTGTLDPYMGRIILILLYAAGLRLNEALSLTMEDVDLNNHVLKIRETKFNKTRLVPFCNKIADLLADYLKWHLRQDKTITEKSFFFSCAKGEKISHSTMQFMFRRIRKIAHIKRDDTSSFQPRIHDLRHTFAVHRLISWYQNNDDVQKLLPILSTYLGHVKFEDTTIYLRITKNTLNHANKRFQKYAQGGLL